MSTPDPLKQAVKFFENVDDISKIVTGRRLRNILGTAAVAFGEDVRRQIFGSGTEEGLGESPYAVLGLHPDAPQKVVDWAYRALAHEYHPDSGKTPDVEKMKKINAAYEEIKRERRAKSQADKG